MQYEFFSIKYKYIVIDKDAAYAVFTFMDKNPNNY